MTDDGIELKPDRPRAFRLSTTTTHSECDSITAIATFSERNLADLRAFRVAAERLAAEFPNRFHDVRFWSANIDVCWYDSGVLYDCFDLDGVLPESEVALIPFELTEDMLPEDVRVGYEVVQIDARGVMFQADLHDTDVTYTTVCITWGELFGGVS